MDDAVLLGRRIKEVRQMRGFSQEELAERMDVNAKYLSSVERGRENPTLDLLARLARALEVDLVDLFNYSWLKLGEAELKKKLRILVERAELEQLREILAAVKAREF